MNEALQRLRTEYVDVMMLRNPPEKDLENGEVVKTLEQMRAEGKVRWIGVSTTLPELQTFVEWNVFDVVQISYSALEREQEEWMPKWTGRETASWSAVEWRKENREKAAALRNGDAFDRAGLEELQPDGETRTSFMLRYTLSNPHVHTTIVGTTNVDHLDANVAAAKRGPLSEELRTAVEERLDASSQT